MATLSYQAAPVPIRDDIVAAHQRSWQRLARPGTWWDGAQRVAIAAETRQATACVLCRERQAALSPSAITGTHDSTGAIPEPLVEVIHRIRTDASRLTKAWYQQMLEGGLDDTAYVEMVGVIATIIAIDPFTPATVYAGSGVGVVKTTTGGQ